MLAQGSKTRLHVSLLSYRDVILDGRSNWYLHLGGTELPLLGPASGQCTHHIHVLSAVFFSPWGHSSRVPSTHQWPSAMVAALHGGDLWLYWSLGGLRPLHMCNLLCMMLAPPSGSPVTFSLWQLLLHEDGIDC